MEELMKESCENDRKRRLAACLQRIRSLFARQPGPLPNTEEPADDWDYPRENPYLPRFRMILEQVLTRYGTSYREFRPLLIDTDMPPESLLDEDQVEIMLEQISRDLNFLRIETDRPAYFADYIQRMYEDGGLVVQVCPKGQQFYADVNAVLDMEQKGVCPLRRLPEHMIYIPIYKRRWGRAEKDEKSEAAGDMENLDISIPIGYNTVIVKGE